MEASVSMKAMARKSFTRTPDDKRVDLSGYKRPNPEDIKGQARLAYDFLKWCHHKHPFVWIDYRDIGFAIRGYYMKAGNPELESIIASICSTVKRIAEEDGVYCLPSKVQYAARLCSEANDVLKNVGRGRSMRTDSAKRKLAEVVDNIAVTKLAAGQDKDWWLTKVIPANKRLATISGLLPPKEPEET